MSTENVSDETIIHRPDLVGIACGAQYKLEAALDGVTEYALVIVLDGRGDLYEMSTEDLKYLARQITGLVGE